MMLSLKSPSSKLRSTVLSKNSLCALSNAQNVIASDYSFLDCGDFKRLERFGNVLVSRSCPAASNRPKLPPSYWNEATIRYTGSSGKAGVWTGLDKIPSEWNISFGDIRFCLAPSDLGQVGIFPEQQDNWQWIQQQLMKRTKTKKNGELLRVLNGFAYTGGSTMAAAAVDGVDQVVHLDAAKSSVQWATKNVALMNSHQNNFTSSTITKTTTASTIRWIVDDCLSFLKREIRRGNKYEGLIFDPPAFGRGGGSKIWKIEDNFPELAELIPSLLSDDPLFVLLSCHDPSWSANRLGMLLGQVMGPVGSLHCGSMDLEPAAVRNENDKELYGTGLSCGVYARWTAM
eukprot:gene8635-17811_t